MRRSIGAFLALVMVLALTGTAWATPADTVTVGGVTLNSTNRYAKTDANGTVTPATGTDYNIEFTPGAGEGTSATLTLKGAKIVVESTDAHAYGIEANGDLTVSLIGTNTIQSTVNRAQDDTPGGSKYGYGIEVEGALVIQDGDQGNGKLQVKANTGNPEDTALSSRGIRGYTVTINSGVIDTYGTYSGIASQGYGNITINGGTVIAKGISNGMNTMNIHINGGKITAEGGTAIFAITGRTDYGTVTITGGDVTANGIMSGLAAGKEILISGGTVKVETEIKMGMMSDAIEANDITISGGEVTAIANGDYSTGMSAQSSLTITGDNTEVTATGNAFGMTSVYNINITGGKVKATGHKNAGIAAISNRPGFGTLCISGANTVVEATGGQDGLSADKELTITGGTVTATGNKRHGIHVNMLPGFENANITITGKGTMTAKGGEAAFSKAPLVNGVADNSVLGKKEVQIGKASPSGSGSRRPSSGDDKALSPNTFDAGIGMSVVSLVLSATGAAWISRKKD